MTYYRRTLPSTLTSFESKEGIKLFTESLLSNYMKCYFPLASQFHTQSETTFCGLGTLVTILNSLAIDPGKIWKGVWRWYSEEMLDCCKAIELVVTEGLTLAEVACLGRCNDADVGLYYAEDESVEAFRDMVKVVCGEEGYRMALSYDRKILGQTGSGHFSPIGGYHEESDSVLILDVARFKYPPHWAPVEMVFRAMNTVDVDSGKSRGYLVFKNTDLKQCVLCQVSASRNEDFLLEGKTLIDLVEDALKIVEDMPTLLNKLHSIFSSFNIFSYISDDGNVVLSEEHTLLVQDILSELRQTELFQAVAESVFASETEIEHTTILILALLDCSSNKVKSNIKTKLSEILDISQHGALLTEIEKMRSIFTRLGIVTEKPVEQNICSRC